MKKILFAFNPVAGTAKVKKNLYDIVDFYDRSNCLVTLCPARKMVEYADGQGLDLRSFDLVVCSGGDGTLNLIVSFCQEKSLDVTLAYVPSGSTNDYAYSIGIPGNMDAALRNTLSGTPRRIDIGNFNSRYFLYVAAFGIFTKTSYSTPQKSKNLLGHMAYILEGIKQLSEIRSYHMKVTGRNISFEGNYMLGLVTNTLSVGGFKNLLPRQNIALDDGEFEVLLIQKPSNLTELHGIVTALLKEKLEDAAYITFFKSPKVVVHADEKIAWTLDGEYGGEEQDVEILNMEKRLAIVCEE